MSLPPGPPGLSILPWMLRPGPWMLRMRRRYGDMFSATISPTEGRWVFLSDPNHVKQVFTGDPKVFHAGEGNIILKPLLGANSVLLLDEDEHMRERKRLLPPFHGERIRAYERAVAEIAEAEIAGWPRHGDFELLPRMQSLTLEAIMAAVFGMRGDAPLRAALRGFLALTENPVNFLTVALTGPEHASRLPRLKNALRPLDALLAEQIARRRREPGEDILSGMVEAGMPDASVRDELLTLLIAGHETTATALSWAVERLVRSPHGTERLADPAFREAVVTETLRLRPVLPVVLRRLQAPVQIGEYEIPAGVSVAPCVFLVHRRADVYPEPHAFRPERWLDGTKPGTYTWIPFGGGVRRCLGAAFAQMEMRVVLEHLPRLRATRPEPEATGRRAITLVPARGAEVAFA